MSVSYPLTSQMCSTLDWLAAIDDGHAPRLPLPAGRLAPVVRALVGAALILDTRTSGQRRLTAAGQRIVDNRAAVAELFARIEGGAR